MFCQTTDFDCTNMRIAIARSRWNSEIVDSLCLGVRSKLEECKVPSANIKEFSVPSTYDLAYLTQVLTSNPHYDAVVVVGVNVEGETHEFTLRSEQLSHELCKAQRESRIPVINGVIHCRSLDQARERSGLCGKKGNYGECSGLAACELASLRSRVSQSMCSESR